NDSKRNIWIATDKGVAFYNGTTIKTYTTNDGLPSNDIYCIKEDDRGRIWLLGKGDKLSYFYRDSLFIVEGRKHETFYPFELKYYHGLALIFSYESVYVYSSGKYLYNVKDILSLDKGLTPQVFFTEGKCYVYYENKGYFLKLDMARAFRHH